MVDTPKLNMPYIEEAQAQKHVTHNEAIQTLDAVVQLSVIKRTAVTAPVATTDGDAYLVASPATGSWLGLEGKIVVASSGGWLIYTPTIGWRCYDIGTDELLIFKAAGWVVFSGGGGSVSLNPAAGGLVGVNATADTTNRLSVSSPATLLNHEGNGHQLKLNKNAAADTTSLLFQDGFSGRSEIGLTGDDDFHFKVSADGTVWKDAILIDGGTGEVTMPNTTSSGGASVSSGTYTPTLGSINTNSYAGVTGLNIEYARYTLIDKLCFVRLSFTLAGITTADLLAGSTLTLQGLPFPGLNTSPKPVDQFASGAVYNSIGAAKNTLLGGYCAVDTLYLFTFALATNNAKNTDHHFVSLQYEIA